MRLVCCGKIATGISRASSTRGAVCFDLMERWRDLGAVARALGLAPQRPFVRMALGRANLPGDPDRLAIAAGPEFG